MLPESLFPVYFHGYHLSSTTLFLFDLEINAVPPRWSPWLEGGDKLWENADPEVS